jgi:hypothetical protein
MYCSSLLEIAGSSIRILSTQICDSSRELTISFISYGVISSSKQIKLKREFGSTNTEFGQVC